MLIVPITIREANDFVASFHRHNGRTARNGGKFAIGVGCESGLKGVAIVGNPLSASLMDGFTAEVLRLCVIPNAPKGACSKLYSRCWQIWRLMGGLRLITYTLQTESGASLRGAGWRIVGETRPQNWTRENLGRYRDWQPIYGQKKFRWEISDESENPDDDYLDSGKTENISLSGRSQVSH